MQSYRFDGLVQGRLLHLQLALLKLVKVIPTLRRTQTGHFEEVQTTGRSFLPPGTEGEDPGAAPLIKPTLIKQTGSISSPLTRVQHDTTAGYGCILGCWWKSSTGLICALYIGQRLVPRHADAELASRSCCYWVGAHGEIFEKINLFFFFFLQKLLFSAWHSVWEDIWALNSSAKFSINMIHPFFKWQIWIWSASSVKGRRLLSCRIQVENLCWNPWPC